MQLERQLQGFYPKAAPRQLSRPDSGHLPCAQGTRRRPQSTQHKLAFPAPSPTRPPLLLPCRLALCVRATLICPSAPRAALLRPSVQVSWPFLHTKSSDCLVIGDGAVRLLLCSISALRWELPVLPDGGVWFPAVDCHAPEGRRLAAKMLEVSSSTLVQLLSFRLCFFSNSGGSRGGAMCRRCVSEDPGSAKSNYMFVRVFFVILHI